MVLSPHPLSFDPIDLLDFGVLCSFVSNLTCDVHEYQVVGVEQPTYAIIFYAYVWEFEQESTVKDDLLLHAPHMLYPDIFYDSSISVPYCENAFPDVYC